MHIASPASLDPGPLVTSVRARTGENVDSMGFDSAAPGEGALDEVAHGRGLVARTVPAGTGQPLEASSMHQHRHCVVADGDPTSHGELGVHPRSAVGAPRLEWIWVITSVSHAWRMARGEGGLDLQA